MSVPVIKDPPRPRPGPVPVAVPVVEAAYGEPDEPTGPAEQKLTGRARRVAEAMATRDAQAAMLAAAQGTGGTAAGSGPRGRGRIGKVVKLLVAAAVVGVLALDGPHLVSTAGTWGPDLWAQLNGRSASACAPVSAATGVTPAPKAVGKKAGTKRSTATRSTTKPGRRARARQQRQRQTAAATRTQALESPVC
jgi:hypothetical protein